MRFHRYIVLVVLGFVTGCAGFVQPAAVRVNDSSTPPAGSPSGAGSGTSIQSAYLQGNAPVDGYLRLRATSNLTGISYSWADGKARSKFKKLLVTSQLGNSTEIPIMSLDVTGQNPAATTKTDVDIAKLMHVTLDKGKNPGTSENPTFNLTINAVPITLADAADKLAEYANQAISLLPPGSSIATTFSTGGTADLVKGLISIIGKEASEYKKKSWKRTVEASVQSGLSSTNGRVNWILCPDSDNTNTEPTTDPNNPPQTCNNLPRFYSCAQDETVNGVLSSICTKDAAGNLKMYTDFAWITLQFELMDSPGTDVIPNLSYQDVKDEPKVSKWKVNSRQFDLSPTHKRQISWYTEKLDSLNDIMNSDGPAQFDAFLQYYAASTQSSLTCRKSGVGYHTEKNRLCHSD